MARADPPVGPGARTQRIISMPAPWAAPAAHPAVRLGESRHVGRDERHAEPEHEQQHSHGPARGGRPGEQLLAGDERRDQRHPAEAHHADGEQRRHQRPAAPEAPGAVPRPRSRAPAAAVAPALGEEHHRAAALDEARPLQRRHLVDGRGHDHAAGHISARLVPGQKRRVDRADELEQAVAARPAAVQTRR